MNIEQCYCVVGDVLTVNINILWNAQNNNSMSQIKMSSHVKLFQIYKARQWINFVVIIAV